MNEFTFDWQMLLRLLGATGVVSLFMPLLVSVVVQAAWPRPMKELAVIVSCLVVSAAGVAASGQPMTDLMIVVPAMVVMTRITYQQYWKKTGIAEWIEEMTTLPSKQPQDGGSKEVAA